MSSVSSWTIFDSDVERRDETPAFPAEQTYDLAGACWDSANPRCRLGRFPPVIPGRVVSLLVREAERKSTVADRGASSWLRSRPVCKRSVASVKDDKEERRPGLSDPRDAEVRRLAGAAHRS